MNEFIRRSKNISIQLSSSYGLEYIRMYPQLQATFFFRKAISGYTKIDIEQLYGTRFSEFTLYRQYIFSINLN